MIEIFGGWQRAGTLLTVQRVGSPALVGRLVHFLLESHGTPIALWIQPDFLSGETALLVVPWRSIVGIAETDKN